MSKVKTQYGKGVEICVSWVEMSGETLPSRAVKAGDSCFVIRAEHNGEYIPGKFVIGHHNVYVSYGGEEISKSNFQVLVNTSVLDQEGLEWKLTDGSSLPKGAIIGGTDNGVPLYIVRSDIDGEVVVGKFHPEHSCAYVPYDGKEFSKDQFEVLCCVAKHL